jgi:hypothetical protein
MQKKTDPAFDEAVQFGKDMVDKMTPKTLRVIGAVAVWSMIYTAVSLTGKIVKVIKS